jgi:hypothetical protein
MSLSRLSRDDAHLVTFALLSPLPFSMVVDGGVSRRLFAIVHNRNTIVCGLLNR